MSCFWSWIAMILLTAHANIGTAQYPSCPSYTNKSEPWRNVGFCSTFCNNTDIKLKEGWYRFIGIGGDQVISSCARAQINTAGSITNYNLFTCNSNINYTDYITCSQGFTVYYLRPTKRTYATRHSSCSNSSSCGDNAQCGAVYGSCVCEPGLTVSTDIKGNNTYGCSVLKVSPGCQTAACAQDFLNNIDAILNNTDQPLPQTTVELYLGAMMNITTTITGQNSTDSKELIDYGNNLLAVTGKLLSALVAPTDTNSTTKISVNDMEAQIFSVGMNTTLVEIPLLYANGSSLNIDLVGISQNNKGSASAIFASYASMGSILKPNFFKATTNTTKTMMSTVVSATLPKTANTNLTKPVSFTFMHSIALNSAGQLSCVYWKDTEWVENGCSITTNSSNFTVCSCTHLSTFALIMQTNPDNLQDGDDDPVMELINTVAVSVGLVFLILTILTLAVCQRGQNVTNTALLNLCLSLFLAHLFFLLTQQYLETVKKTYRLCVVLAGVIHFLFLSAFVWMLTEAVLLYIFVKNLSRITSKQQEVLSWKCMLVIGYIIPLSVVGVTSGLYPDAYGNDRCWLKTKLVWSFLGPVTCILAINLLLSCVITVNLRMALSKLDRNVSHLKHTRTLVFKTLLQFIILGCPWTLGFFAENSHLIKIVFLFFNSQQGTFIFFVHCVLNQEIRQQYRKWWIALRHSSMYKSMAEDQKSTSYSHSK
ncbi:adhesion G protein-coupled receptor E3 [Ictalurus punctatus]|uniref:Adhesion G protein-coupled receptor E3 n=1 Tax=Ictalurus punctatus TaxID=7998 RepID=A0A2D0Q5W6_ICTPU|nr:adhesion G protein-coupled receptor E3 [Ictalurus punctatus]